MHPSNAPKYRPDIDGLRAVAVLAVVGYHAFPSFFLGGFIGVDVFFVISGFLITRIIQGGLDAGRFSVWDFYDRRIRRIFPALIVVLASVLVAGSMLLMPTEFKELGLHVVGGAGFFSNLLLWSETGYFDTAAETKPLLHLWSLGIEEQFYLLWPLVLWAVHKLKIPPARAIVVLGIASFGFSLYALKTSQPAAFFSPQTRAWELLAGALLAVTGYRRGPFGTLLLGALAIFFAAAFSPRHLDFPGAWALVPVVGAALVISGGPEAVFNRRVLAHPALVWVGTISFPLYLWHWPLLSFARIWSNETPSLALTLAAVALAFLLAWATFRFIERPIRFGSLTRRRGLTAGALTAAVLFSGSAGVWTYLIDGTNARDLPPEIARLERLAGVRVDRPDCINVPTGPIDAPWTCTLGDNGGKSEVFFAGDSHAHALLPAMDRLGSKLGLRVTAALASGCPPILGVQSGRGATSDVDCRVLNERVFAYVKANKVKTIVMASRWSYYTNPLLTEEGMNLVSADGRKPDLEYSRRSFEAGFAQTIDRYRREGVQVYLLLDNPNQRTDPLRALRQAGRDASRINYWSLPASAHTQEQRWSRTVMTRLADRHAKIISFDDLLCDQAMCRLADPEAFLYADRDHLSIYGASVVYPRIEAAFLDPLARP